MKPQEALQHGHSLMVANLMHYCSDCLCVDSARICHCIYDVYGPDCGKRGRHERS